MVRRITVVPKKFGSTLVHPIDGPIADNGSEWTMDQFTASLLRDGDIIQKLVAGAHKTTVVKSDEAFDNNNTSDRT